ncbi:MAG: hypothetical protein M3Y27_21645 [Acidobacteriota bacterium]|nr:hypothetical protein [Acidobacteriota bacterium]
MERIAPSGLPEKLETLEHWKQDYDGKFGPLRSAIDEGDASGVALGEPFARVRETLKLPKKQP